MCARGYALHSVRPQLSFFQIPALGITAATQKEKKEQQAKRLKEMAAKRQEEKVILVMHCIKKWQLCIACVRIRKSFLRRNEKLYLRNILSEK